MEGFTFDVIVIIEIFFKDGKNSTGASITRSGSKDVIWKDVLKAGDVVVVGNADVLKMDNIVRKKN